MATKSRVSESSSSEKNKRFRWVVNDNDEKVVNLIKCITHYKTVMEFDNRDFKADKVKLYEEVRKLMEIYEEIPTLFGPVYAAKVPPEISSHLVIVLKVEEVVVAKYLQHIMMN